VRNSTEVTCRLPLIDLPPELIEANSSSTHIDLPQPKSRRRRHSGGWNIVSRLWDFVQTGSWRWSAGRPSQRHQLSRQKRSSVASISNRNVSMTLHLGFIMDKLTTFRNISKTRPHLRLQLVPFTFLCDQTPVNFDPSANPLIKIKVT